jgi:hypothetical protein
MLSLYLCKDITLAQRKRSDRELEGTSIGLRFRRKVSSYMTTICGLSSSFAQLSINAFSPRFDHDVRSPRARSSDYQFEAGAPPNLSSNLAHGQVVFNSRRSNSMLHDL